MNETKIQPEILERLKELPELVQKIILESGWEQTTRRIVEENNLRIDQGAAIENEVMLTMFGFEQPENFRSNIIKEAGLSPETADKIVADVDKNVFGLIKDKLVLETTEDDTDFEKVETREQILSEIEKPEINEIPADNTASKDEDVVSEKPVEFVQEEKPTENKIVTENLDQPVVSTPQKQTIDPYREPVDM
jgi:hypothetical protein